MILKQIAIILLNWNGKKDTLECLFSLKKVSYPHYAIFIADNGSTDDSISTFSKNFPDVRIIDNQCNLGFAEGNNRAIQKALQEEFDYILLLNNDTIVDPCFLDAFLNLDALYPNHILGAKIHLYSQPHLLDHLGGNWNLSKAEFNLIGYREEASFYSSSINLDYVTGCCLFASRKIFEKVGLLDARFFLYWEESDFCQRAKNLGYFSKVCPEAKVFHKVSASFIGGKPHTNYFYWRNRFLFAEKNLARKDLLFVWCFVFIPSIIKLARHYILQHFQYFLAHLFWPHKKEKKLERIKLLKTSLCGVKDYFLRKFYNGPSWIFKKT